MSRHIEAVKSAWLLDAVASLEDQRDLVRDRLRDYRERARHELEEQRQCLAGLLTGEHQPPQAQRPDAVLATPPRSARRRDVRC